MQKHGKRLDGKFALITGASRGIGRATALRFAAEGATVGVNYVGSVDAAQRVVGEAHDASAKAGFAARQHLAIKADVSDPEAIERMFRNVLSLWGRLDVLVNNAGIQAQVDSVDLKLEDYRHILDVNLTGAMLCAQHAIRHFLTRPGGGGVINCSSVHQTIPKPGFLAYSISKGGMENLTRTLALEYADKGIRVNAVGPGAVLTDMNASWDNNPKARADVEAHIPMGRAAEADEMASVFAFLASEDASYITGQTIFACGGLTLYGDFKNNWSS